MNTEADYWQSWAEWPKGVVRNISGEGENNTVDRHDTEAQAQAVCDTLMHEGLGGERLHFPIRTWVVPVCASKQPKEDGK
jgi:hypothetical protein